MDLRTVITLLFLCSLFVEHNGIEFGSNLSEEEEEEDLELEKQLKLLNKPAVKTIETEYGDIYDCVDFYKQPAFDHPLLKNHTFKYYQSLGSKGKREGRTNRVYSNVTNLLDQKRENECPIGTVPIRRTTKEHLIGERLASKMLSSTANAFGPHYAVIRTRPSAAKYAGAGAYVSIHRPGAVDKQYSAARLKIQNGPNSVQVGWRVDQSLYGDTLPRMFIRLDAGQSHCFNTRCPGFVVTNPKIALDEVLPYAERGGPIVKVMFFLIVRDQANGNWILKVDRERTQIGFWPRRLFSKLGGLASNVEWGGEAFSPGRFLPPMGSGYFPIEHTKYDGYFRRVSVIDEHGHTVDPHTEEFADRPVFYKVIDKGNNGEYFGRVFLYGGPGGGPQNLTNNKLHDTPGIH